MKKITRSIAATLVFTFIGLAVNADNGGPGDAGGSPKDLAVVATATAIVIGLVLLVNIDNKHDAGQIIVNASGGTPGYTYQWDNNQKGASIKNLKPGKYTVTVTDAEGHTAQKTFTIEENKGSGETDPGGNDGDMG